MREKIKRLFHKVFNASLYIKSVYAVFELIIGTLLFFLSAEQISRFFSWILHAEILEDPNDLFLRHFFSILNETTPATKLFVAWYLIVNGILKCILLYSLFKEKTWAYPIAGVVISFLVLFEIRMLLKHFSWFIISILFVDLIILVLLRFEYLRMEELHKNKN